MVAMVLGVKIAQGGWFLPALLGALVIMFTLYRLKTESLGSFILAGILAGYFIGNRGFAQLMPAPTIPLLPAEAALAALVALQFLEQIRGGLKPTDSLGRCIDRGVVGFWPGADVL